MLGCTKHPSVGTHGVKQTQATADESNWSMLKRAQPALIETHVMHKVTDDYATKHATTIVFLRFNTVMSD